MKILIVINTLKDGGAERVASLLANQFSSKHSVHLVTRDKPNDYFYQIESKVQSIQIPHSKNGSNSPLLFSIKLSRIILQIKPDLVISFMTETNILAILSMLIAKIVNPFLETKIEVSERTDPREKKVRMHISILRKMLYPLAYRLVVQTEGVKEWAKTIISEKKIKIIPNPVNLESIIKNSDPNYIRHPREFILCIGRLSFEKGHDLAIEAFKYLAFRFSELDLVIVGDGPLRFNLEKQVQILGLSNRVFFEGKKKNIYDYLLNSEFLLLPSRFEGFPNVLAEALVTGTPSISNNCNSGPSELLKGEMAQYLIQDMTPEGIANKIELILLDTNRRDKFKNFSSTVRQELEIYNIAKKWIED